MAQAFHLDVGPDRLATLTFDVPGKRVNVFSPEVLFELRDLVAELARRGDIGILVLKSGKDSNFIAGADVAMIADVTDPAVAAEGARLGQELFSAWAALPFPTVAAIRGTCMGGGTEWALASTWRVASDREAVAIGLPEIKLGILPGWGGCTRLPRTIGLAAALDVILTGKTLRAKQAAKLGLVDALVPDAQFLPLVRQFALEKLDRKARPRRRTNLHEKILEGNPLGRMLVFSQARKATLAATKGQYPAPLAAIEVIKKGVRSVPAGLAAEARAIGELATSPVAKNLIHVFGLMEDNKRSPGLAGEKGRPVEAAVVLGAGVMGGGIGHLLVDKADIPTRLKDIAPAALASGMAHAAELFEKQVRRRRMRPDERKRKLALLSPTLDDRGFGRADLVIEAVVEKLEIKQKVFADTAAKVRETTVLASNTSSLPIDAIARDTPHPERVVGMHFFNPVDKMPLVEVIAGEKSAPWAVNTVFELTRRVGKTPVLVRDAPGFLVNRLLMFSLSESLWLLDEGVPPETLDRAMKRWGMPMGPLELTEEVGIDVATKVAHILHDAFGDRLALPEWFDRLTADGRLGAKNRRGFFRYDEAGKRQGPDPEAIRLLGLTPRPPGPDADTIVLRMVTRMVDEAARCLAERVVATPGELDLAMIFGTGFPLFRGGLCRWADQTGLDALVARLETFASSVGPRYTPSDALRRAAAAGGFYRTRWEE